MTRSLLRCCTSRWLFDHPRWCRPHPVCLWVILALGHGRKSRKGQEGAKRMRITISRILFCSGRNLFCCLFLVFCHFVCKSVFLVQNSFKTGNLTSVWYVSILSVPGIQFRFVTVLFEAFSRHKTMKYTLKVRFTILNNLIWDWGFGCNCIINGRVELLVEYTLRRLRSKILYFIPRCHSETG